MDTGTELIEDENYYWLEPASQKIWGFLQGRWLASPEIPPTIKADRTQGIDDIRQRILFYGGDLGELKNKFEKIQEIQSEYAQQLADLRTAKAGAEMRDNTEDVAEIKGEYRSLLQEMNAKIQEVPGG